MITIVLLLLSLTQTPQQPPVPAATTSQDDYTIGAADVITVIVFGEADASRPEAAVDTDGTIDMPLIGRIKVGGLTTRAAEKLIHDRLAKDFLVNPSVNVQIVKYRSKTISVQGYVRSPGDYPMEGNVSLTSALAKAGSLSFEAGSVITINHRGPDGKTQSQKVSRKDVENGQAQNIILKDGDVVVVPKAETFFVNGQVRNGGSYTWEEGLTIERALSLAGGLTDRAGRISVERNGKVVTKKANKSELVQANDTIRVGTRIF